METFDSSHTPSRAVCAVHPDTPATATCPRCGNFACQECTEWGAQQVCPACRDRLGVGHFPFSRDNWSVGGLLSYSWDVFVQHWLMSVLISVIVFAVSGGVGFVLGLVGAAFQGNDNEPSLGYSLFSQIVQTVLNMALGLGTIGVFIDVLQGGQLDLGRFLSAMRNLGKALVQYLVVLLALWLPLMLVLVVPAFVMDFAQEALIFMLVAGLVLLLPILYVSLGLVFMQYELVFDESCGPLEAIRRSWSIARGHRLWIFLVGLLGAAVLLVGVLLCCVGALASYPIFMLLMLALYLALRNGSGLPGPSR